MLHRAEDTRELKERSSSCGSSVGVEMPTPAHQRAEVVEAFDRLSHAGPLHLYFSRQRALGPLTGRLAEQPFDHQPTSG